MRTNQRSLELLRESQQLIPGGVNSPVRAFRAVGGEPLFIERGEGPYAMVFGVKDIEAARARARALGYEPGEVIDADDHPSTVHLERIRESIVTELLSTAIVFGEVVQQIRNQWPSKSITSPSGETVGSVAA